MHVCGVSDEHRKQNGREDGLYQCMRNGDRWGGDGVRENEKNSICTVKIIQLIYGVKVRERAIRESPMI